MSSSNHNNDVQSTFSRKTSNTGRQSHITGHGNNNSNTAASIHSGNTTTTGGSSNKGSGSSTTRRRRRRANSSFQYAHPQGMYQNPYMQQPQRPSPIQIEVIPNTDFAVNEAFHTPQAPYSSRRNDFGGSPRDEAHSDTHTLGSNANRASTTQRSSQSNRGNNDGDDYHEDLENNDPGLDDIPSSRSGRQSRSNNNNNSDSEYEGLDDLDISDDDDEYRDPDHNPGRTNPQDPRSYNGSTFQQQGPGGDPNAPIVVVKPKQIHQNPQTPTVLPRGYAPINHWARFKHSRMKEFLAEFLGTFVLILIGDGVCCQVKLSEQHSINTFDKAMQLLVGKNALSNNNGTNPATSEIVSLLTKLVVPNGAGNFTVIMFAWATAVVLGFFASGGSAISGGHLNPAVTLTNFFFRGFPANKLFAYISGQLLGGYVGGLVVFGLYNRVIKEEFSDWKTNQTVVGMFCTVPIEYLRPKDQVVSELIATMIMQLGIFSLTDPYNNSSSDLFPVFLFFLITACNASFAFQTGAAMNFGRDFGPRAALATVGVNKDVLFNSNHHYFWVPIVVPIVGALLGATIYDAMIFQGHESPINTPWYQKVEFFKYWNRRILKYLTFGRYGRRKRRDRRNRRIAFGSDSEDEDSSINSETSNKFFDYDSTNGSINELGSTNSSNSGSSSNASDDPLHGNDLDNSTRDSDHIPEDLPLPDIDEVDEEQFNYNKSKRKSAGPFGDLENDQEPGEVARDIRNGDAGGHDIAPASSRISFKANSRNPTSMAKNAKPKHQNHHSGKPSKREIHFVSSNKRHHRTPVPTVEEE
ncbi:hypothetical protein ACO0QE_003134 [Hanseniaspora vineae]